MNSPDNTQLRPYTVDIPQASLDDLRARLVNTRWITDVTVPDGTPQQGWLPPEWDYGVPVSFVRDAVKHWLEAFDWRQVEARLNAYDQFLYAVDGIDLHLLHVRSEREDAQPLLLLHGWPSSVLEFLGIIDDLIAPPPDQPAFHLVIPSLPGYGFSGPVTERGWDHGRSADAIASAMHALGYERWIVHGNDMGAEIAPVMGRQHPDAVRGVHVTQIFSFPSGDPAELANLSDEDRAAADFLMNWNAESSAYAQLQRTRPNNLAHALNDSPAGQLAWSAQLLSAIPTDALVAEAAMTWLTQTAASSARSYYEAHHMAKPEGRTTVPIGLSSFAFDFRPLRVLVDRDHSNVVQWNEHERGSHWSAHDAPDLLVADLREFSTLV